MQLHQIQPKHKAQKKHRVGRGGKKGTYSGRGMKGQKARAGAKFKPIIRELIKRYPKLRGYRVQRTFPRFRVVSLQAVEKAFNQNEVVNPESLFAKHLIRRSRGKMPQVKILVAGDPHAGEAGITKALVIEECAVSKSAKKKIEKAGGAVRATSI